MRVENEKKRHRKCMECSPACVGRFSVRVQLQTRPSAKSYNGVEITRNRQQEDHDTTYSKHRLLNERYDYNCKTNSLNSA